jgi:hypothetical protein
VLARAEPAEQRQRRLRRRRVDGERDGEAPRDEAERRVEADVVHRARHRLEPHGAGPALAQPRDAGAHDLLPEPAALRVRADGEGPHPPLAAREVRDVERGDLAAVAAPEHRPLAASSMA